MNNLSDIKLRSKTVADTRQITGAMETISVAKMRKAMIRYDNNIAYFNKIRETISDIVLHTDCMGHKYLNKKEGNRAIFIVIASDKGLAGGFNHNVLNFAYDKMKSYDNCSVFAIGQMAAEYFERKKMIVDIEFSGAGFEPNLSDAEEITNSLVNTYDSDLVDEVHIVYTHMKSGTIMYPDIIKLLPLSREDIILDKQLTVDEEECLHELEYEPSPEQVLAKLIPQYLKGIIYGALIQSNASEHSSRRAAMSNATKNADEILEDLKIEYNRARQEAVTNELTEIITGAAAVNQVK